MVQLLQTLTQRVQHNQRIIHHQYLIIEIYMIGDNVHGMCLIVVLLEKVLVLIGGMPITGISAARDGYRIDGNPTVGSIAQSDAGYYGHVAFVERVNSNGSILVSEMNFSASPGILTYRTIPAYQVRNYKFIH